MVYDADGALVRSTISDTQGITTTVYVGEHQEWVNGVATNYYHFGGRRVAMRTSAGVSYLHADQLQSTTDTTGSDESGPQYYYPYGAMRGGERVSTPYQYTGQGWEARLGLYYYNARWYDPAMRRFVQADTIVPEPGNPQSLNRYSYSYNNPLKYTDPDGHSPVVWACQFVQTPMGQQLAAQFSMYWAQAQALAVQLGPALMQGAQLYGPQSPALIEKAGQTGRALRNAANQAGNTAGPGGLDPNKWGPIQEQLVRDTLAQDFDQIYGTTDEAIRRSLGMTGKTSDFVGYNSTSNRWLIAESKGSDMQHAVEQLQNTYDALISRQPGAASNVELDIYVSAQNYARLLSDPKGLAGYVTRGGYLGWMEGGTEFTPVLIEETAIRVAVMY